MRFLSIPEFSKSPQAALSSLAESEKIVLTSDGKPTALIIYTDEYIFEDALLDLRKPKAKRDLLVLQMQSIKNGNSKMTMDEINAEIKLARQERNAKNSS